MGQATLDLPDPLESQPLGSAPSADDLLAQMAGDEIDRLLADADAGPKNEGADLADLPDPTAIESAIEEATADAAVASTSEEQSAIEESIAQEPTPPAVEVTGPDPAPDTEANVNPELARQLDGLFEQLNAGTGTPTPEASKQSLVRVASEPAPADPQLNAQLDGLFNDLAAAKTKAEQPADAAAGNAAEEAATGAQLLATEGETAADTGTGVAEERSDAQAVPATESELTRAAIGASAGDPEDQTSDLARQVLAGDVLGAAAEQIAQEPAPLTAPTAESVEDERLPFYLWPLALLSAPLGRCGDGIRQAIAKVAIVTLINALAILIYVLIFRR